MKIEDVEKSNRQDFIESFIQNDVLLEMPMRTGPTDTFSDLVSDITDSIEISKDSKYSNYAPITLSGNYKKIQGKDKCIYWYESNDEIVMGAEFDIKPESLAVKFSAKNPKFKGSSPYVSDLYMMVLDDLKHGSKSIRVDSDSKLSDAGFKVWKQLFNQGATISVYDTSVSNQIGQSLNRISSLDQLEDYFKQDPNFEKYRYTLSESSSPSYVWLRSTFRVRATREKSNTL